MNAKRLFLPMLLVAATFAAVGGFPWIQLAHAVPPPPNPPLPTEKISIKVDCTVDNGDGTFTSYFGYVSDNAEQTMVPYGDDNKMTPAAYQGSQPEIFDPGRHDRDFSITYPAADAPVVWTLKSNSTRTASAGTVPNTLDISQDADENVVGTPHNVSAIPRNFFPPQNPVGEGVKVMFRTLPGSANMVDVWAYTDVTGAATFSYEGVWPGVDYIQATWKACGDENDETIYSEVLMKTWVCGPVPAMDPGLIAPFGKPGSVLIYPYVNSADSKTLVTITNTNGSHVYCGGGIPDVFQGSVRVKLIYVFPEGEPEFCVLEDRELLLTPNDTISFFADDLFEEDREGWLIVAAISYLDVDGKTYLIDYDHLVGSAQVYVSDVNYVWAYDAFSFRSFAEEAGCPLIQDGCGHYIADRNRDDTIQFDGMEYDHFPLLQVIPQFFQPGTGGGTHDDFSNFLAVASTRIEGESRAQVFYWNNSEDQQSEDFFLKCFKAGDLVGEFDIPVDFLEGDLDLSDDPDEVVYSGWMLFYLSGRLETAGILSVFAQNNGGLWYSGANNWVGPLIAEEMMPRTAEFYMMLNEE
jgi:hypothetical protein